MVPAWIVSSRLIVRHSVDLPAPDGPMTTTTSPASTSRSMSVSTSRSPKDLVTPSSTTSGADMQLLVDLDASSGASNPPD